MHISMCAKQTPPNSWECGAGVTEQVLYTLGFQEETLSIVGPQSFKKRIVGT